MVSICHYESPLGGVLLAADEIGLTGLWFDGQKYFARGLPADRVERETPALLEAKRWLDIYFSGKEPDFTPPLHPIGSAFRQSVWEILLQIPYGKTTTYGEIARQLSEKMGLSRMSAQAVGGAVGHNKIAIIIPCHRVVGTNGSLTGYAGGIDKKGKLLELEQTDMTGWENVPAAGEDGTIPWNASTILTTNTQGKIEIDGLDADTYYLREIEAPAGYNGLGQDVEVKITGATKAEDSATLTYTTVAAEINNQSGTELPSTGGMGTTVFYILGSVLVLGAAVVLVTRKRMKERN